jgi:imidazolonepropionase
MTTLLVNIRQLLNVRDDSTPLRGAELSRMPCIGDAWLLIEDGVISSFGPMSDLPVALQAHPGAINVDGGLVLPAWCDSHTHIVFAGSREEEFVDKIRGLDYAEIARRGGGILNSARRLNETSEDELFRQSWKRVEEVARMGTGALEIKSGYGLCPEGELKMLRVIRRIREKSSLEIRATFLGAHAFPERYRDDRRGYIDEIVNVMLPVIAAEGLADFIDVFCEQGFFSVEESSEICRAGKALGLRPKIHANQLHASGGVQLGVELGALSVDHLESMDDEAVTRLAESDTVGTMLPTAAFFLRMQYQPARRLIDAGCAVALASDYNPGSSPSGNMNLVVSMACIAMRMLPEEAIQAATLNGACAMGLGSELGSISVGKKAHLIVTEPLPSFNSLPYLFGRHAVRGTIFGKEIRVDGR